MGYLALLVGSGSYVGLWTLLLVKLGSCFLGGPREDTWYSDSDVSEGGNWLFVSGDGRVDDGELEIGGELGCELEVSSELGGLSIYKVGNGSRDTSTRIILYSLP